MFKSEVFTYFAVETNVVFFISSKIAFLVLQKLHLDLYTYIKYMYTVIDLLRTPSGSVPIIVYILTSYSQSSLLYLKMKTGC